MRIATWLVASVLLAACSSGDPAGPRDGSTAGMDGSCPSTIDGLQAQVLATRCATAGCHAATTPAAGLDLASPNLGARLVGVPSGTCRARTLVVAGDPSTSFLYEKISTDTPQCGARMPFGAALDAASIDCVRAWIVSLAGMDAGPPPGDAGPLCSGALTQCGTACFDLRSDPRSCGSCGRACGTGSTCEAGSCVCMAGLTDCGGTCVDTTADRGNCGACGTTCTGIGMMPQVCSAGSCTMPPCPLGTMLCSNACVSTQTSVFDCGGCGNACAAGMVCSGGTCACGGGTTDCGGVCIDTQTSAQHCGGCGNVCPSGQSCSGGTCGCTGASMVCGGVCVDTSSDPSHCGGCGNACAASMVCNGGVCGCALGTTLCGGSCIDTASDPTHCGSCTTACGSGQYCAGGACVSCGTATLSGHVQPILTASCATMMCHSGTSPSAGLSLASGQSHGSLVNVLAGGCTDGRLRVEPFRPDRSYLINKVTGVGMCFGMRMPLVGGALTTAQIDLMRSWICSGAPDN